MPRRRIGPRLGRVLAVIAVLVVVTMVGGYWYARPLLLTGTGYAAHNACGVQHVAGRPDPATDLPPNPLVPYLRTGSDGGATVASVLGVLAGQQAYASAGFGCTLAADPPAFGAATPVTAGAGLAAAPDPALDSLLAAAFGDDLDPAARGRLGTRAVVVVRDGRIVGERYAPGFSASTPQLGWSMAKSVTSLLVGRLVAQDKITLATDRLRPEWTDERARITVEQLLRMTSGLSWDETYDLGTPITRMLYLEPDMGAYVASLPLAHPAGTYQQYSSGSTTVLRSSLTAREGVGPNLPRRELFAPLGLTSAVWEPDATGTPVCSSYLWATPRDWATIGQFALQGGVWQGQRLLPTDWMTRTTTALPVAGEETGYAAGWWANRQADGTLVEPSLPPDAYWAQGHDGQLLYVVPSARLVVVRLGFSPGVTDLRTVEVVERLVAADTATR